MMRWRTNISVLAVSIMMTLTGALFVSYGNARILLDSPVKMSPFLNLIVLAFGVCGILLYIAKDLRERRHLRLLFGVLLLTPLVTALLVAGYYRSGIALAAYGMSIFTVIFAMWNEEPAPEDRESVRELFPFFSAVVLILMGVLHLLLLGRSSHANFLPVAYAAPFVGLIALMTSWYRRGSVDDRIAQMLMGATYALAGITLYVNAQPILALICAPFAALLILSPFTRYFNLGMPTPKSLSEENRVVRQFEQVSKLTAWMVYIFTYFHLYYAPTGIHTAIFLIFVSVYALFVIQYDFLPVRFSTYSKYLRESLINIAVLALVGHITGGPASPYNWFFIFIVIGGTVSPKPLHVLYRIALITPYFLYETLYLYFLGGLTRVTVIDELLMYFVIVLTGAYAYQLSSRRKEVEDSLMRRTDELAKALNEAEAARFLATERGREIELSRKRDEAIMASLGDAVIALDRHGAIVQSNPAAEGVFVRGSHELRGRKLPELFEFRQDNEPKFTIGNYIDSALKGNAIPLPENMCLAFKDGRCTYLDGTIVPIMSERREILGAVLTFRDVTYLREVDQMKTSFLSVAAHQLRTPLASARWFLELLNDPKEGKLKENQKMFAENGYRALRNMVDLVNRLLAVTRLEAGRVPVKPEPVDVRAMTEELIKDLASKLKDRSLDLHLQPGEALPTVQLDRSLSREVFTNLIENAIRYTPDGGVILVTIQKTDEALQWTVRDTGIGIPPDQQVKIFQKFFRADNAVGHTTEGSGLGLYLAKFIVGTWGGKIWFESQQGKGTTFHVTIPFKGMTARAGQVSLNA